MHKSEVVVTKGGAGVAQQQGGPQLTQPHCLVLMQGLRRAELLSCSHMSPCCSCMCCRRGSSEWLVLMPEWVLE